MNPSDIYRKSAQGTEAMAARHGPGALAPKLRSLLIMVDGKRTAQELARLTMQPDVSPVLEQLLEMGLIERVGPAAIGQEAPPIEPPRPVDAVSLREAQRFVARRLTDMLGPAAEDLCMKVEATRSAADFMKVMTRVEAMVRDVKGAQAAEDFTREVDSHRPG